MSDDLDNLEEILAPYQQSTTKDRRVKNGSQFERSLERGQQQNHNVFRRLTNSALQRKAKVTLAGSKS